MRAGGEGLGLSRRGFLASAASAAGLAFPARAQGATYSVTTDFGTFDIPADPQRILLMGNRLVLETALALDLPRPVAMTTEYQFNSSRDPNVAPWVDFDPAGIGIHENPTVTAERILAYEPDLILARHVEPEWYPDRYKAISRIAPMIPLREGNWRADLTQVARWLRREDQLARTFAAHDALRDDLLARHGRRIASARIVFGSVEPPIVWLANTDAAVPAAQALRDLGGLLHPWPASGSDGWLELSPENLGAIGDADALLFWAPTRDVLDTFISGSPLWARLPVVQAGRATLAPNNVGSGSIYTVMETLRLWDQVYATLA